MGAEKKAVARSEDDPHPDGADLTWKTAHGNRHLGSGRYASAVGGLKRLETHAPRTGESTTVVKCT